MLKKFQGLKSLFPKYQMPNQLPNLTGLKLSRFRSAFVSSAIILGMLYGVRQLGGLQQLELLFFDQMMRSRPDKVADPRLLLVTITESDIKQYKWPLTDRLVAQTLSELNRHQPAAIAVDLNLQRNIPIEPERSELIAQLRRPNVIAAVSSGNNQNERIDPPVELPKEQVGLVDLPADPDGFMRRVLLFTNRASLSIQLLNAYLRADCPRDRPQRQDLVCQNLKPSFNSQKEYQLGEVTFPLLKSDSGAYQTINSGGYQILINTKSQKRGNR
ncbi:CHASE2 domain-containing protein [Pseudanabaena minima]|uniref:CHASE2 domain-containing protein n=1 Tax=Pseudanabaena minima TaxID=890415 RepID=UPI003DA8E8CE